MEDNRVQSTKIISIREIDLSSIDLVKHYYTEALQEISRVPGARPRYVIISVVECLDQIPRPSDSEFLKAIYSARPTRF